MVPQSLAVVDTPAEVRTIVDTLKSGDRVEVLARTPNWARVRLADGRVGWVEEKALLDSHTYGGGQQLLGELGNLLPQAVGHSTTVANLRLEPSRDAPELAQLRENQSVAIFERRLVDRPPPPDAHPPGAAAREAWYLIRADSRAGWVIGRLVALDVPEAISTYAQGVNLVGWLVLNTVDDDGRKVPQYLVADRVRTQDVDFNHIRVFTWWKKHRKYVTAYVEGDVNGYFPIRVVHLNSIPYFRLRLVDSDGRKFQRIYGLFETITRSIGTVDGWESDAMPTRHVSRSGRIR